MKIKVSAALVILLIVCCVAQASDSCPPLHPVSRTDVNMRNACVKVVTEAVDQEGGKRGETFEVLESRAAPIDSSEFACMVIGRSHSKTSDGKQNTSAAGVYNARLRFDNKGLDGRPEFALVRIGDVIVHDLDPYERAKPMCK